MYRKIADALPRFVGLNEFFRRLSGAFIPQRATAEEKRAYIEAIGQIHGFPEKWLDPEVRSFKSSAIVREVRKYSTSLTMVRFEVCRTPCEGSADKYEKPPLSLLLALNAEREMQFYTLIYGTGRHTHGVKGWVCRQHIRPSTKIQFASISELMLLVDEMRQSDFFIVEECGHERQFVQAYCDEDREGKFKDDPLFLFEYCVRDWIWQFAVRRRVNRKGLKRLLRIYEAGGIPALQDAVKWQQMYISEKNLSRDIS